MRNVNVTLACEVCGTSFHPIYKTKSTRPQTVCSMKCEKARRFGPTPANKCLCCGVDISQTGKRAQKFCSLDCRVKHSAGKSRAKSQIAYGKNGKYLAFRVPEHPNADCKGYVMVHRLVMEVHLGRHLDKTEVVHHINNNPRDNRVENLAIMTKDEHNALHRAELESALAGARKARHHS